MNIRKKGLAAILTAGLAVGLSGLVATGASAAIGDDLIPNGGFDTTTSAQGYVAAGDFAIGSNYQLADYTIQGSSYGLNSMYDEGRYVIGSNPNAVHASWVNWVAGDNMLLVNGYTGGDSTVLSGTVQLEPCALGQGANVPFLFTMNAANIVDPAIVDGPAVIEVFIDGTSIGTQTLGDDPSVVVPFSSGTVPYPADGTVTVSIVNHSSIVSGNDFAIDDLSLKQTGECTPPPRVGGLTIGYYKNHKVSEANWDAARAGLNTLFGAYPDWAQALAVLNTASSKNADSMLKAQAIAFALNVENISGFGDQIVIVPANVRAALGLGSGVITADQYLTALNANYAALNTKTLVTDAKTVLDVANQDA